MNKSLINDSEPDSKIIAKIKESLKPSGYSIIRPFDNLRFRLLFLC